MIYTSFLNERVSLLGFGAMRLPTKEDGGIDIALTEKMLDYAISNGVNYFDTAYPYHGGESEIVLGKLLAKYPRNSYYLATKYPGHQIMSSYNPAEIFEEQLKKCGVDYFDFYLLHNVYEKSMETYTNAEYGIIDYFLEQRRLGRIRHLGFSTHAMTDTLRAFLDRYGDSMEFCQIQMNYLDYTLQDAKGKYELLSERGIPAIIMEGVRGGRLARLPEYAMDALREVSGDVSAASVAFRWFYSFDNILTVLSGMSDMAQVVENIDTFAEHKPLTESELRVTERIAEGLTSSVPCTACRYCTDGCPMGLDIPMLIATNNELRFASSVNSAMRVEFLPEDKRPEACIACGACTAICPQGINIPEVLAELTGRLNALPKWADMCREREEAARRLREEKK